jgi:hypothetical protein
LQAGRLRVVVLYLPGDLDEIFGIVPEFHGWQTLRRAGVGLATQPALHEQGIPAADNADQRLRQGFPLASSAMKLVSPKPLPVTIIVAPCLSKVRSAIAALPTMSASVPVGTLTTRA